MRVLALALLFIIVGATYADDDEAALSLADKADLQASRARDWRALTEGALVQTTLRDGSIQRSQRLSLDGSFDTKLAPQWRAAFADRLDLSWRGDISYDNFINTLKEAYVSWQPDSDHIVDAGRVNLRYGVATGYNPTDFFRFGAVRSVTSINPTSLRENRLGSVIVSGQTLWNSGSLRALYSPKISDQPNNSPFSPDFGATNNIDRWLIAFSQKLVDDFNPQWLLYGEQGQAPQFGVNTTALINDATVAYVEASGGRSVSQLAQATMRSEDEKFYARVATGVTYTAPSKLSVTLEYDYNGAAPDETGWNALRRGSLATYVQYRNFTANRQDFPTKQNVFLFGRWQDAFIVHFDLSAMQRYDVIDDSRLSWFEARYHWDKVDAALQWQRNHGNTGSQFGALPQEQIWQAIVTYFF